MSPKIVDRFTRYGEVLRAAARFFVPGGQGEGALSRVRKAGGLQRGLGVSSPRKNFKFGGSETLFSALIMRYVSEKWKSLQLKYLSLQKTTPSTDLSCLAQQVQTLPPCLPLAMALCSQHGFMQTYAAKRAHIELSNKVFGKEQNILQTKGPYHLRTQRCFASKSAYKNKS